MRDYRLKGLALALLVLLLPVAAAAAERVALVIGNGAYADRPLRNPVNDAADLAAALERLGFQVLRHTDLDRKGMHRALQAFRDALRGKELGLFYYAGHGAQHHNRNYLIPVRAEIKDAADLPVEALEADSVLAQMQSAGNTVSVVILDACRNLPYPGADRAGERGLARLDAIRGSLVAYATGPGSVALDGDGRNSPYAAALLAEIGKPGVTLTELFNNVGWAVAHATNNAQEPWYSTSPLPKIYLAQESSNPIPVPPRPVAIVPTPSRPSVPQEAPAEVSRLQPGQVFRDTLSDGTRGPAMMVIPSGEFWMGSPETEKGRGSNERQHMVRIGRSFAIGQYEVTFDEYDRFCAATGREKPSDNGWGRGTRPVINVYWDDAVAYADWLSKQTGQSYRLPTEAEWEYAARAGTETAYWWGNEVGRNRANCNSCGNKWDNKQTAPIGSFNPNSWGLYDTVGNVWEWTCSLYQNNYNGAEMECATSHDNNQRANRGGAWSYSPRGVRSAYRSGTLPKTRDNTLGFRLARSL